jgi:hypothetical protein
MGRIMNWFVAVYNCVIAAWAEQSQSGTIARVILSISRPGQNAATIFQFFKDLRVLAGKCVSARRR